MQPKSVERIKRLIRPLQYLLFLMRVNWLLSRLVNRPVVLSFHQIKEPTDTLIDRRVGVTDPDIFEKIIIYMTSLGYKFVTLDSLVDGLAEPRLERVAAVTFDDGFKDLYLNAYPILKKFRIPFTLFLITSTVGSKELLWLHKLYISIEKISHKRMLKIIKEYNKSEEKETVLHSLIGKIVLTNKKTILQELVSKTACEAELRKEDEKTLAEKLYLNKAELLEMEKYGLNIEPHGHEHWPLSELNQNDAKEEIEVCVKFIEEEFSKKCRFFALPFTSINMVVEKIVKSSRLSGVCFADQKLVEFSTNRFSLSRILPHNDIFEFSFILTRRYLRALKDKIAIRILPYLPIKSISRRV